MIGGGGGVFCPPPPPQDFTKFQLYIYKFIDYEKVLFIHNYTFNFAPKIRQYVKIEILFSRLRDNNHYALHLSMGSWLYN